MQKVTIKKPVSAPPHFKSPVKPNPIKINTEGHGTARFAKPISKSDYSKSKPIITPRFESQDTFQTTKPGFKHHSVTHGQPKPAHVPAPRIIPLGDIPTEYVPAQKSVIGNTPLKVATPNNAIEAAHAHGSFSTLNLHPLLLKSIVDMKYLVPTPIQGKTIPYALEGKDILGCAQTGTGKTAAFLVPIIHQMINNPNTTALILVPTRELALQIQEVLKGLTSHTKHLAHAVLIGGMSMQPQLRALQKKPRFIIATPGRMIDHLGRRSVSLSQTAFLVLDEADRMLDMGFIPQLREIFKTLPKTRQTFLFTATLPPNIVQISKSYMHNPVAVSIGKTSTPVANIKQSTISTTQKEKNNIVVDEINARKGSIIIFARTQRRADRLHKHLESFGLKVGVIHGGKSQGQRTRALDGFRNSLTRVLVATDVASRGLDIPHVAHVINYDLPDQAEDYVHRIGRTARAGNTGEAVSLIIPEEKNLWRDILKLNK